MLIQILYNYLYFGIVLVFVKKITERKERKWLH